MSIRYSHLLDVLLVQDLLHGQQLDDPPGALVERRALLFGVAGVAEGDEEAALAAVGALAFHDGLEGVDVGAADPVGLLDLHGEPVAFGHACRNLFVTAAMRITYVRQKTRNGVAANRTGKNYDIVGTGLVGR